MSTLRPGTPSRSRRSSSVNDERTRQSRLLPPCTCKCLLSLLFITIPWPVLGFGFIARAAAAPCGPLYSRNSFFGE